MSTPNGNNKLMTMTNRRWSFVTTYPTYWGIIQQLVRKAGDCFHFLDIGNCGNDIQIIGLLQKIDKMVAGNRGGHFMVEKGGFHELGEKMRRIKKRAEERITEVQSQRSRLRSQIG